MLECIIEKERWMERVLFFLFLYEYQSTQKQGSVFVEQSLRGQWLKTIHGSAPSWKAEDIATLAS